MRCVITDYMGDDTVFEAETLASAGFEVFVAPSTDPHTWESEAITADAILTRHALVRAQTIERLERCRIISRYGTGHDNIDLAAAQARGIVVTNVPGYCTDEVADHAMTLLLMAARHIDVFTMSVRAGGWTPRPLPPVQRVRGRRLGLVGFGKIGAAVARRARAFGMTVSAYDPFLARTPQNVVIVDTIEEILVNSDFVSLHAPLNSETRHILDADRLSLLPRGAIVVNVARGGLLDLDAAIEALRSGHLAGVAVDVTEPEPPPPQLAAYDMPGLFLTPHVGYYSQESVEEAKRRSVGEIIRVVKGEPAEHPVRMPA